MTSRKERAVTNGTEYLRQEAERTRASLKARAVRLGGSIREAGDLRAWTRSYPRAMAGGAVAGSFTATAGARLLARLRRRRWPVSTSTSRETERMSGRDAERDAPPVRVVETVKKEKRSLLASVVFFGLRSLLLALVRSSANSGAAADSAARSTEEAAASADLAESVGSATG